MFIYLHSSIPVHTVPGVLKARILKWFAIPLSSGSRFVRPLHHDMSVLGGPTRMAWFICGPCDQIGQFSVIVVFSLSALWQRLTEGKLGLVLMSRAMLSKSLIQFSVDGWGCVPSLFTWGQTMVEVMKTMVTSLTRSHVLLTLSAPSPAAGHHRPAPLPETPGHPQASPGQSPVGSLLLSPGSWCTRFCCALQGSISQTA